MAKSSSEKTNLEKQLEKEKNKALPQGEILKEEAGAHEKELAKADVQGPAKEEKVQVVTPEMLATFKNMRDEINALKEEMKSRKPIDAKPESTGSSDNVFDDYMEVPVVFFAYQYRKSLFADTRKGILVPPPGPKKSVFFERLYRYVNNKGSRGESEVISISQVKVQSKALCKWMREHSLYNIQFFETMSDAMSVDTSFQDKLTTASNQIGRYSEHQIIEAAKLHGLSMIQDIAQLRKNLINKMAKDMLSTEEKHNRNRQAKLLNKQTVGDLGEFVVERVAIPEDGTVTAKY